MCAERRLLSCFTLDYYHVIPFVFLDSLRSLLTVPDQAPLSPTKYLPMSPTCPARPSLWPIRSLSCPLLRPTNRSMSSKHLKLFGPPEKSEVSFFYALSVVPVYPYCVAMSHCNAEIIITTLLNLVRSFFMKLLSFRIVYNCEHFYLYEYDLVVILTNSLQYFY